MTTRYYIDLSYACFGIEAEDNKVTIAAPIARWAIGKEVETVLDFYKRKGAKIIVTGETNENNQT